MNNELTKNIFHYLRKILHLQLVLLLSNIVNRVTRINGNTILGNDFS